MNEVQGLAANISNIKSACETLGVPKATYYRHHKAKQNTNKTAKPRHSSLALTVF